VDQSLIDEYKTTGKKKKKKYEINDGPANFDYLL
jgi:hypothetical protein